MVNIAITFILHVLIVEAKSTIEISSCDKICITRSLRADLNGTYHFLYYNTSLNGPVYYNADNKFYLHPYIKSQCDYQYLIQPFSSIGTSNCWSSCNIHNPPSGYVFDPNDCIDGWQTYDYDNDVWNDNPNQRLVNCNNVSVSGNDKSWLDGTYVWLQFNLAKKTSLYYCKECGLEQGGAYLYGGIRWSKCSYSSSPSNDIITLDDCGQWSTWDGSVYNVETDMTIGKHKCPLTIDTSSISGPNCTNNPGSSNDSSDEIYLLPMIMGLVMALGLLLSFLMRYCSSSNIHTKEQARTVIIFNTIVGGMTIWTVVDNRCVNSEVLTVFVVLMPLVEWIVVNFMVYLWYQSQGNISAGMKLIFFWIVIAICIVTFGTSTACFMVSSKIIGGMMLVYFFLIAGIDILFR